MACGCGGNCQCNQGGGTDPVGDFEKGSLGQASAEALFSILTERAKQSSQWGDEHDDEHTDEDWTGLILEYLLQKQDFVAVGALAMAAIEAKIRRTQDASLG